MCLCYSFLGTIQQNHPDKSYPDKCLPVAGTNIRPTLSIHVPFVKGNCCIQSCVLQYPCLAKYKRNVTDMVHSEPCLTIPVFDKCDGYGHIILITQILFCSKKGEKLQEPRQMALVSGLFDAKWRIFKINFNLYRLTQKYTTPEEADTPPKINP